MILAKEQIYRYMRHISIPEISGQGQKNIIESSTALFSDNIERASLALYYLAASGIGNTYCCFKDPSGWDILADKLEDLNSEAKMTLKKREELVSPITITSTRIIIGDYSYVKQTLQNVIEHSCEDNYIPTIISIQDGWKGILRTFSNREDLAGFAKDMLKYEGYDSSKDSSAFPANPSAAFGGIMAVLEHLKLVLSIGKPLNEVMYYDLAIMDFVFVSNSAEAFQKLVNSENPKLSSDALSKCKVLVVGCGGLGSPAAYVLAASGIGQLGLVDYDTVEISNLNRQIMHSFSRIGVSKVQSGKAFLEDLNPNVKVEIFDTRLNKSNVMDIISPYDIIIGGLDNLPSRYILNDACYLAGKPLLEAGALDISGLATTIIPKTGHCYRCIFPESSDNNLLPSCEDTGVLGPVPGIMGIIQAAEAIKLLAGIGKSLENRIFLFDVFDTDIYVAPHGKNRNCELCS